MSPHRILVLAEGQLGDLILLTPALRALKNTFPWMVLSVLVVQRRAYVSAGSPSSLLVRRPKTGTAEAILQFADEVLEVSRHALRAVRGVERIRVEWSILKQIRAGKYDTVISCFPEDRFAIWAALSGARTRIGQNDQPLARLYTVRPRIRKEEVGVLRYYAALATAAGATVRSLATEFRLTDEDRVEADHILAARGIAAGERFVAVHPGASGPYRIWPPDRFARVMEMVKEKTGMRSVLCGTPHDLPALDAVRSALRMDAPEIVLEGSVHQLAGILTRAKLCLSNDSGPRHLAIAVGTPSVAILPKHNDKAWGVYDRGPSASYLMASAPCPLCPPERCLDRHPDGEEFGSACMRMVSVDEVVNRILPLLTSP
jgi:ADP-heptose:LPS heptosyltransferase